jgi:sugar lactone lactonase YvrE
MAHESPLEIRSEKQAPEGHSEKRMAALLDPFDDVATALVDLAEGAMVRVSCANATSDVRLVEPIPAGHKFATRALASGLRVRKYGQFIGRITRDVPCGGWVHVHNLETSARRRRDDEHAWSTQKGPLHIGVIGAARTTVGESPLWDAAAKRLYWVDVRETPAIHMVDVASGSERSWPMGEDIGSIVPASGGGLVAALRSGFAFFAPERGALTPIADPEPQLPRNRMNDGKCDAAGRLWCGSMNPESGIAEGSLYVMDGDLQCRCLTGGFFTPNGPAWSLDERTFYLADTRRGCIFAFDFASGAGTLGERRVFADLGALPGGPDGATMDCEGYLWSAQFDGGCLIRYAPDGIMDRVVRLPVTKPTSCTFGGEGYRQLFVTTATRGLDDEQRAREPMAGRVLVLDVGVAGLAANAFVPSTRRSA